MITKLRIDVKLWALYLFVVMCFVCFYQICSEKIDAVYFTFMIYALLKFLDRSK